MPVARSRPPKGAAHFYHNVRILDEGVGAVRLALGIPTPEDEGKKVDLWYAVSGEPTDVIALDEYGLRFDIEENSLDDKSNGFQVDASKLDDPSAISPLFLIPVIATLHSTSVGVSVVRSETPRWVDTHWDRRMSDLRTGWKWRRSQPTTSPLAKSPRGGLQQAQAHFLAMRRRFDQQVRDQPGPHTLDFRTTQQGIAYQLSPIMSSQDLVLTKRN